MGIPVVFTGEIVIVLACRFVRRQGFEPSFVVTMQSSFIIVDKHRCRDVHGIDEAEAFLDFAFTERELYFGCDVDECTACGDVKPQLLAIASHEASPSSVQTW
jgi:hypothetical protein